MTQDKDQRAKRREPFCVAYMILSHRRAEQVEALAARILELSPSARIVVHHDPTGDPRPWAERVPDRVHFVDPVAIEWGDWSMVEATLRMLRFSFDVLAADWFALVSGDDRPIVDLGRWEAEIGSSRVDGIVKADRIRRRPTFGRSPTRADLNYVRYMYRWRRLSGGGDSLGRSLLEFARKASRRMQPLFKIEHTNRRDGWFLGLPRRARTLPGGAALYVGPQWLAFSRRAAEAVFDANPELTDWYRETWIPDQSFFQTVLYNSPGLNLRNAQFTFIPESRSHRGPGGWMLLRTEDFERLEASGSVFARKFDPEIEPDILRMADDAVDSSRRRSMAD